MIPAMPRDTTTKHQGVFARHKKDCRLETGGECYKCQPSCRGKVWDSAREARERFVTAASEGKALNKRARRYTRMLPDDIARARDQLTTYLTASKDKDQVMYR
jgi:hypothetical protein